MDLRISNIVIGYDANRGVFALRSEHKGIQWQLCEEKAHLHECNFVAVTSLSPLNLGRIEKLFREGLQAGLFDTTSEISSIIFKAAEGIELKAKRLYDYFNRVEREFDGIDMSEARGYVRAIEILGSNISIRSSSIKMKEEAHEKTK